MRIDAAAKYLEIHKNVIAVCCGGIVHDDQTKSEAQAIFEGLCKRGIEEGRLILEDKSKTTAENFINAKKIIDKIKLEKTPEIAFLSSEFHLLQRQLHAARGPAHRPGRRSAVQGRAAAVQGCLRLASRNAPTRLGRGVFCAGQGRRAGRRGRGGTGAATAFAAVARALVIPAKKQE